MDIAERERLLQYRNVELAEWNKSRRTEVVVDVVAHLKRAAPGCAIFLLGWQACNWLDVPLLSTWRAALCCAAALYISVLLLTWLRLWGAYIERRLEEIEARVEGDGASYYSNESFSRIAHNGLHEKLDRVVQLSEEQVSRFRVDSMTGRSH